MQDDTESFRRARQAQLNAEAGPRAQLEAKHGPVWTTEDVRKRWEVLCFAAPFVVVRERATGLKGSLEFQNQPRFYFNYQED